MFLAAVAASLLTLAIATSSAQAQISKPTENELNAVPPQFNDLVHGRSDKINSEAARRAGGGPPPMAPPPQPIANPSTDPRDFTGNWAGAGPGGPPGAEGPPGGSPAGSPDGGPNGAPGGPPGGPPSRSDDPRPGRIVNTSIDANRLCEPTLGVLIRGAVIYQTPQQLTLVSSDDMRVRRFYLDGKPDGPTTPSYAGRSTAHWQGNTLVIHTTNLKGVITPLGFDVEIGVHKLKIATPTLEVTTRISKSGDGRKLILGQSWEDGAIGGKPFTQTTTLDFVQTAAGLDNECAVEGNVFGPNYGRPDAKPLHAKVAK